MVDKLKKKLDAVADVRSEMLVRGSGVFERDTWPLRGMMSCKQALESQLKTLRDENTEWESKYTALIRSRRGNSGPTASGGIPVCPVCSDCQRQLTTLAVQQVSESQVSELSVRVQQLEVALHAKEVEVGQLREMSFERDQSGAEDDTSSLTSDEQNTSPIKYRKRAQPLVSGSMASPDAIQTLGPSKASSPESTTTRSRFAQSFSRVYQRNVF